MPEVLTAFALLAVVLTVSGLVSPLVERAPLSFPMVFLGLGILLGPRVVGLVRLDAHSPLLEAIATSTLSMVLFLDAVNLRFDHRGRAWLIPMLVLGPGTLLTIAGITLLALLLLQVGPVPALLLGTILASTDPVVLRDVVRDRRVPSPIRDVLRIEAGTNDVVVLPIVLVLIAVAQGRAGGVQEWLLVLAELLLLGPAVGFTVGALGSWLIARVDDRLTVRREYQALFGVGLVLLAYVAGQTAGGDGFLAAFAAGIAVSVLNRELCDCFFDYSEISVEMAMLLSFILFGAVLSTLVELVLLVPTLVFAVLAIGVVRPVAINLALLRTSLSRPARAFLAWFGPRGLSSLLLALLVVLGGVPDAEWLLATVGVVVLVSVMAHGVSATPVAAWYERRLVQATLPEEREGTAVTLLGGAAGAGDGAVPRITPEELARRLEGPDPPLVLDVRSRAGYRPEQGQIPGSLRLLPDEVVEWASTQAIRRPVVAYCT
jgi:NhaP-type Na+/H+ or K+/H+ antiporter